MKLIFIINARELINKNMGTLIKSTTNTLIKSTTKLAYEFICSQQDVNAEF